MLEGESDSMALVLRRVTSHRAKSIICFMTDSLLRIDHFEPAVAELVSLHGPWHESEPLLGCLKEGVLDDVEAGVLEASYLRELVAIHQHYDRRLSKL